MDDSVREIVRLPRDAQEFQIADTLSDGHALLVSVDHAYKRQTFPLAAGGLDQEILILGEQHPAEGTGAVEQLRVRQSLGTILLRGQDFNASASKPLGDCCVNVVIHIECNAQGSLPRARMRARNGETASAWALRASTRLSWASISASSSGLWS